MSARVALVTGGGRGIGRAIALRLARDGCAVALAARSVEQLEEVAATLRSGGAAAIAIVLDVSDPAAVEAALAQTDRQLGAVDVLVNNAGIAESAPLGRTDLAMWERHLRVNATAPYLLARAVLPGMLARGYGRIVNVASLAGLYGAPYITAYTASKHALVGLTRALAAEVAGKGVTVNALCPGYVATDMVWAGARRIQAKTGVAFEAAVQSMADMNPGRRLIQPEEVADAAARLLHDDGVNGEAIVLDGTGPPPPGRT